MGLVVLCPKTQKNEWDSWKRQTRFKIKAYGLLNITEPIPAMERLLKLKLDIGSRPWSTSMPIIVKAVQNNAAARKIVLQFLSYDLHLEYAHYEVACDLWAALKRRFEDNGPEPENNVDPDNSMKRENAAEDVSSTDSYTETEDAHTQMEDTLESSDSDGEDCDFVFVSKKEVEEMEQSASKISLLRGA